MSQLIVSTAQAAGNALSGAASSLAQGVASGAARAASAYAVTQAEALIYGPARRQRTGPRTESLRLQTASEGTSVPVVYGRVRLAGEVIWASDFLETVSTDTETTGGKGGGGRAVETTTTSYLYSVSLAIGLCEGVISRIGRVWADGKPINLQEYTFRLYHGTEDQLPDSAIEAVEGAGLAPAYRGLAYIVFEDLPLAGFGNRIPQFTFEIERPLASGDETALENAVQAVCLIPGSGEAAYATMPVLVEEDEGITKAENVHNNNGGTDFVASVRALAETLPACAEVSLVVSWFGTDLRAGFCEVRPGVELADKTTLPDAWSAGGVMREDAHVVSTLDGTPAYGGTPSDRSVVEAIQHLKARGFKVCFYPFILMDVPPGNNLPDLDGGTGQPAYPWRGRIGVGADDKTAAARTQLESLFGDASASDFSVSGTDVSYDGPTEWNLNRMVLHYAHLCAAAGGVDTFLIGSEMRGITTARDGSGSFPAVEAFASLAAEARAVLGAGTAISYAADWSEYGTYQTSDGTGDVLFPLDDLWASEDIDFIGIDNYMPLADWRDGKGHLDAHAGWASQYDIDYLQANIKGGEGYDWYYASAADRDSQSRTPIADSAHGEDWVFRYKDLWNWWSNAHHPRPGGIRSAVSTAYEPEQKPIRFTELGAPAIDKAANQPNVFYDPKSSESEVPYYSSGGRDDFIQRRFLEAHLAFWNDPANNPSSSDYTGRMVETGGIYLYAWDARPYPDFPARETVWADAPNWSFGHWLNGRVGRVPLSALVDEIAGRTGLTALDTDRLQGLVTGYVIDRSMSPRAALEPLAGLYQFDAVESGDVLRFIPRGSEAVFTVTPDELAVGEDAPAYDLTLAQAGDLPGALEINFLDEARDYALAVAAVRQPRSISQRTVSLDVPVILETGEAEGRARSLMADALVMARQASFALPPSLLALEPADVIALALPEGELTVRIGDVLDGQERAVNAVATSSSAYTYDYATSRRQAGAEPASFGPPAFEVLDLPLLIEGAQPALYGAAFSRPWPGGISVWRDQEGGEPVLETVLEAPARMGRLAADLAPGPVARWDEAAMLRVRLTSGSLSSASKANVLAGANVLAVKSAAGGWEILRFAEAALQPDGSWLLSSLLRGLVGSEEEATAGALAGSRVVVLTSAVQAFPLPVDGLGLSITRRAAPRGQGAESSMAVARTNIQLGTGYRPLSPVHVSATWLEDDLTVSWIRRTRIGGDSWEAAEVPLGEENEAYEVDIVDGPDLKRTLTSASPAVTYTAAMIAEDFPAGGTARVEIAQRSAVFGRGRATSVDIDIPPP